MALSPYLTAGIAFPFQNQGSGLPAAALGTDVYRYALILLLKTRKRSRVMNPSVGTNLNQLIFESIGAKTFSFIRREISVSISSQLPQVQIVSILINQDPVNQNTIQVNVQYNIQGVADQTGFVSIAS